MNAKTPPRRARQTLPTAFTCASLSHPFSDFIHGFTCPYLGELSLSRKPNQLLFSAEESCQSTFPAQRQRTGCVSSHRTNRYLPAPTNARLNEEDRKRHLYLVGKTGMGKSTVLLNFFQEDCRENRAVVLIDPLMVTLLKTLSASPHPNVT
jgi:hypothetical protein